MPYLRDMIMNNHKATESQSGECKFHISLRVSFISSKDAEGTRAIYV